MVQKSYSAKRGPGNAAGTSYKWSAAHEIGPGTQPSRPVPVKTVQFRNDINCDELVPMNNQQRDVAELMNCA